MSRRTADVPFDVRSVGGDGRSFVGYASVFDVRDSYGDVIQRGAFARSLRERPKVLMLWQHATSQPIGVWTEIREDERGLFVRGRLSDTPLGREAAVLLADGALDGLSIGFQIVKSVEGPTGRILTDVNLIEISIVSWPANDAARIAEIRAQSLGGGVLALNDQLHQLQTLQQNAVGMLDSMARQLERLMVQREKLGAADVAAEPLHAMPHMVRSARYQALMAMHFNGR